VHRVLASHGVTTGCASLHALYASAVPTSSWCTPAVTHLVHASSHPPAACPAGLPIRPIFSHKLPAKGAMRRKLGMDSSRPAVLLVGGGEGMGKLEATVDEIAQQLGPECQVGGWVGGWGWGVGGLAVGVGGWGAACALPAV
jgi:hypothetical protein